MLTHKVSSQYRLYQSRRLTRLQLVFRHLDNLSYLYSHYPIFLALPFVHRYKYRSTLLPDAAHTDHLMLVPEAITFERS